MGVWDNIRTALEGKATSISASLIDEGEALDASYERGQDDLVTLRQSLAEIGSAKNMLENQKVSLSQKVAKLTTQAKEFADAGNDDEALRALELKGTYAQQIDDLVAQIRDVKAQETDMKARESKMRTDLEGMLAQKEAIKAQLAAAKAQEKVDNAMSGLSGRGTDVGNAVTRAKTKLDKQRARTDAVRQLGDEGIVPTGLTPETSSDAASKKLKAKQELEKIKAGKK